MKIYQLFSIALFAFSVQAIAQQIKQHRKLPYSPSTYIQSFQWEGQPSRYSGTGSDMHWYTWGADNNIYIVDDDGANFGKPDNYAHVLKISGVPPTHRVETVTDFENYNFRALIPDKLLRRYVNGILAVGNNLYVCLYDYDWNIAGKVYDFNDLLAKAKIYNPWPQFPDSAIESASFIDSYSKNAGIAGIINSTDGGKTWNNIPGSQTPMFLGSRFAGMSFITWGPGYSNVPAELGNYVYGISNDGSWETGDNVYIARVHRDSILNRLAWSFYNGTPQMPAWTKNENMAKPIFSDTGHVGHPTLMYNKPLGRYFMMIYSDTIPHHENATKAERAKWDYASELQIYEAPTPFGPWALVYNEMPWGGSDHSCYLGQMPALWLAPDGLSGYIMFAGDYINRKGEYYGLMTQKYSIKIAPQNK